PARRPDPAGGERDAGGDEQRRRRPEAEPAGEEDGAGEDRGEGVEEEGVDPAERDEHGAEEEVGEEEGGMAAHRLPAAPAGGGDDRGREHRRADEHHPAAAAVPGVAYAPDHRGDGAGEPAPPHERPGQVRAGPGQAGGRSRRRTGAPPTEESDRSPHVAGVPQADGRRKAERGERGALPASQAPA